MKDEDDLDREEREFEQDKKDGFYQPDPNPESQAEANRKSGLAYGAVTALIGAILLFLAVGWMVDRVAGTSPWGIVVGIILGAVIGFYQFIRISSKID